MPGLKLEPEDDRAPAIEIEGERATIGRTAGVDHIVNDPSVSRQHAVIECHGGTWTVTDHGSSNGTFVDNQRITTAEIRDGQEIRFGMKGFRVRIDYADLPTALVSIDLPTALMPAESLPPPVEPPPPPPPPRRPVAVPSPPPIATPPPIQRTPRPIVDDGVAEDVPVGFWQDGKQIVFVKEARLPDQCVKCGAPATFRLDRKLSWHPPLLYALLLAGVIPYAIVAAVVGKRVDLTIPLCETHRKRRTMLKAIGSGVSVLGFVAFIASIALSDQLGNATGVVVLLAILAFVGGLIVLSVGSQPVAPARIDDQFVWLKRVHQSLIADLPPWPGQAGAIAELAASGARIAREPEKPVVSRLATSAMYLGILSILLFPAPIAMILGILSILDLRTSPGRGGMARSIFGLVAGLLGSVMLVFALASGLTSDASRPSTPATSASRPAPARTVTIASKDDTLHVTAPKGWKTETDLNKVALLQTCDAPQQVCLIVIQDDKPADLTLARFSRVSRGLILKNLNDSSENDGVSLQIDGHPALQYELRGVAKKLNFVYVHTAIETPSHFYQVLGWTSAALFPKEKAAITGITNSFKAGPGR